MKQTRILIADKDPAIRRFIKVGLESRNFETALAANAAEVLRLTEVELLDGAILDLMLPGKNVLELCRELRNRFRLPVIVLGNGDSEARVLECFNAGADDYVVRPFGIEELVARTRAALRRSRVTEATPVPPLFTAGELKIKFAERQVTIAEQEVRLTPTEYNLLQELALHADRVLTHRRLLHRVWGPQYDNEKEYLRVFIGRLRKKLEPNPRKPDFIITVPWVGYKLRASAAKDIQ